MFYMFSHCPGSLNLDHVRSIRIDGAYLVFEYEDKADSINIEYKESLSAWKVYHYIFKRMKKGDSVIEDINSLDAFTDQAIIDGCKKGIPLKGEQSSSL